MSTENQESQNSKPDDGDKCDETPEIEQPKHESESSQDVKESAQEESEEEELGLLDRPVEMTGSRERKKVQRLEVSFSTPAKDKKEIPEGKGKKLGECPRIEIQIQRNGVSELKQLHKILFNRPGSEYEVKKNIRKFSGFVFSKGSPEYEKKKGLLEKLTMSVLKHICEVLCLERTATKEELVDRILNFLLLPNDEGKKPPSGKTSRKKHLGKADKGKKPARKQRTKRQSDSSKDMSSDSDSDSSSLDSEETSEAPKRKRSTTDSSLKRKSEKNSDKKGEKGAKRKKKADESGKESSDDEPLVKKHKMPSDDEIKKLVKQILDSANLHEITMKKVIKQVADTYPDFDLSGKKEFIKTTVKSVIS